jgi:hypothetical protein
VQEALENAYMTAPMTSFHDYRAKVTGYTPAPNRYFVRLTAPVGTVPTTNWNDQKTKVSGYTQPSNQYFATRPRLAYHPADKRFDSFSGVKMTVEGITEQASAPEPEPAKPKGTLPKGTKQTPPTQETGYSNESGKSRQEQLDDYESDYLQRMEDDRIADQQAYLDMVAAEAQAKAKDNRGSLPKGFEPQPEPEAPKSSKGTLPKGTAQAPPPQTSSTYTETKSKKQELEDYENDYMQRLDQERIDDAKAYQEMIAAEAKAKASAQQSRGTLPKGFEVKPEPEAPKSSKGTLPKGF